jgi:hypothetical protein
MRARSAPEEGAKEEESATFTCDGEESHEKGSSEQAPSFPEGAQVSAAEAVQSGVGTGRASSSSAGKFEAGSMSAKGQAIARSCARSFAAEPRRRGTGS